MPTYTFEGKELILKDKIDSIKDSNCEHLLGVFDTGLGSDIILVYRNVNEENLACSAAFAPFKYCARCGEKIN